MVLTIDEYLELKIDNDEVNHAIEVITDKMGSRSTIYHDNDVDFPNYKDKKVFLYYLSDNYGNTRYYILDKDNKLIYDSDKYNYKNELIEYVVNTVYPVALLVNDEIKKLVK